jgi:hypothetical protein
MSGFLPPVLLELRADGHKAVAELERVGVSARKLAADAAAAAREEAAAARTSADAAKVAADEKVAAAEAAAKAETAAAEKVAAAMDAAAEQEVRGIQLVNEALAKGAAEAQAAAEEQAAAMEKASAAITAAQEEQVAAAKATATAQEEAALAVKTAEDEEIAAFGKAGAASEAMAAKHAAAFKSIGEAANVVSGVSIAAFGIIGIASLEEAAKFQKSTELLVTAGGESKAQLENVRNGIMGIAASTGTSTEQLSEGMYVMEKAGYRGADGLKVLKAAAEGAKAENVDLGTMTQAVSDVMLDYGKKADQAVSVTNGLVAASGAAKTSMQDFASSMAAIVPTASTAGISFAQVGGAIATMTQHGMSAQQASQNLANMLMQLQRPNNVASKAMQQLGIDVQDLSAHIGDLNGGRGLLGSLQMINQQITGHMGKDGEVVSSTMQKSASATQDLHKIMAQMPPDLAKLSQGFLDGTVTLKDYQKGYKDTGGSAAALGGQFLGLAKNTLGVNDLLKSGNPAVQTYVGTWAKAAGGITGARTALMLLMNNADDFTRNIQAITDAEKQNGQDISTWADTQQTFSVQLDMTKQAAANLGIELGNKLMPAAQGLLSGITDLFHGFETGNPILLTAAGIIGGALTISAVNFGIKLGKTAVGAVTNLIDMGRTAITMGSEFQIGFANAEVATEEGATKMTRFGGAVGKALPALGGIAGVAGAAVIGLQLLAATTEHATVDTDKMKKALADFSEAGSEVGKMELDRQFDKWDTTAGLAIVNVSGLDDAVHQLTHQDGYSGFNNMFDGLRQSLGFAKSDVGQLQDRFKSMGDQLGQMVQGGSADVAAKSFDQLAQEFVKNGKSAQDALDAMPGYSAALKDSAAAAGVTLSQQELLAYAMGQVPQKMMDAASSTEKFTDAAGRVQPITPQLKKSLDDAGVSADGLVTDLDKVRSGMEEAGLATVNQRDAQSKSNAAMQDAKKAMDDVVASGGSLQGALNKQKTDFDLTTDAGRTLNDKYEAVMRSGLDYANSIKGTGVDAEKQVQQALTDTYNHLVDAGHQMGITGGKADDLARQVMGIPPGVDIHTWMDDYAKQKAQETTDAVNAIPTTKTVVVDVQVNNEGGLDPGQYANAQATAMKSGHSVARAMGGPIHRARGGAVYLAGGGDPGGLVSGPGTSTSDSIPAMLSDGEYVIRAASVDKYGPGYLEQLNAGTAPLPGSHGPVRAPAHSGGSGSSAGPSAAAGGGGTSVLVNLTAVTNASPRQIASQLGQELRQLS